MISPEFRKNVPLPQEPHERGIPAETKTKQLFGLTVLREQRQLTPKAFTVVTRKEPAELGLLEERGAIESGYLQPGGSLSEVIDRTTGVAQEVGKTPQDLANFLLYFGAAKRFLETDQTGSVENQPQAYEFNGRVYLYKEQRKRMREYGPLANFVPAAVDHTLICIDDGSKLTYGTVLPALLYQHSFSGGEGSLHGLSAREIALAAGFLSRPADDPVVRLVQDPEAEVTLSTRDQIQRLSNIKQDLFGKANVKFAPPDLASVKTVLDALPRQAEHIRLDTAQIEQQPVDFQEQRALKDLLTRTLAKISPDIAQAVLEKVTVITGATESDIHRALDDNFDSSTGRPKDDLAKIGYNTALLDKFEDTEEVTEALAANVTGILSNYSTRRDGETETQRNARVAEVESSMSGIIDTARPNLRGELIAKYREQDVPAPVLAEMSTVDLIKNRAQFANFGNTITRVVRIAEERERAITREDAAVLVTMFQKVSTDPNAVLTNAETAALATLSVNPDLLPYALRAGGRHAERAARSILDGEAVVQKRAEEFIAGYEIPFTDTEKDKALFVVKNIIRHNDEEHPGIFDTFQARTETVLAERDPQYSIMADILINPYVTAVAPEQLRELLLSEHFIRTIKNSIDEPVSIAARNVRELDGFNFQRDQVTVEERTEGYRRKSYLRYKEAEIEIVDAEVKLLL